MGFDHVHVNHNKKVLKSADFLKMPDSKLNHPELFAVVFKSLKMAWITY